MQFKIKSNATKATKVKQQRGKKLKQVTPNNKNVKQMNNATQCDTSTQSEQVTTPLKHAKINLEVYTT